MDSIIQALDNFVLNANNFDEELLIKLNNITIDTDTDTDAEWDELKNNYSKLKYIFEMLNHYNVPMEGTFLKIINKFMEEIDYKTKKYIAEINWFNQEPDLLEDSVKIGQLLEESLNHHDPLKKIQCVLHAYTLLVDIVEDIRGEHYIYTEPDDDFIKAFEPPAKKRKV